MRGRIAVIGGGISGLAASHFLSRNYSVELYERGEALGGHARTTVLSEQSHLPVETGFIIFNERYTEFTKLLSYCGARPLPLESTVSVQLPAEGLVYASTGVLGLLASPANLLSRKTYRLVRDVLRFRRSCTELLH